MIRPSVLFAIALAAQVLQQGMTEECKDLSIGETLQDPEDCHGYFLCHSGHKIQQYCAPGMKYVKEKSICAVGKCPPCNCAGQPEPTPTTSSPTPSTADSTLPTETTESTTELSTSTTESSTSTTESSTSTTQSTTDSSTSTSTSTPQPTESSTTVSSSTPEPTDSSTVSSTTESTSTTVSTTTASSIRPPVSCENVRDGWFFADPIHCRDYYVCRNGLPVLLHCEKGTWFDDINFVCNFRNLVNCPANID